MRQTRPITTAEYGKPVDAAPDAEKIARNYSDSEPFSAYCFRTVADPFAGRINVMKVISGTLQTDANVLNSTRGTMERLGMLHSVQGKQLDKVSGSPRRRHRGVRKTERDANRRHALRQAIANCLRPG